MNATAGRLEAVGLTKWFTNTAAVADLTLDVDAGEFVSIVGPTGSGKSTLLRLIAGFEQPDSGTLHLDGRDLIPVPPEQRPVNSVFQTPSLFPHRTVADNVGFGLRFQRSDARITRAERARRVNDALDLVRMAGWGRRKASTLSVGERQLVALARSLVARPHVLLLDEPLSAVDTRLRRALLPELRAVQRESGTTFLHVTHDQNDALTVSDRVGVMGSGQLLQIGTPRLVYDYPANAFVADVLGVANLVPAYVMSPGLVEIAGTPCPAETGDVMGDCTVLVRPERVLIAQPGTWAGALRGWVTDVAFGGPSTHTVVDLGACRLTALTANDGDQWVAPPGAEVDVVLTRDALRLIA